MALRELPFPVAGVLVEMRDDQYTKKDTGEIMKQTRLKVATGSIEKADLFVHDINIPWPNGQRPEFLLKCEQSKPVSFLGRVAVSFDGKAIELRGPK